MEIYSKIRSVRWALSGYPADRIAQTLRASEQWSREQLDDYRDRKLRDLVVHCYANVPYYRGIMDEKRLHPTDIRNIRDLAKFPVLTKELIRRNSGKLLARNMSKMKTTWSKTGGTTGEPMQIFKNRGCVAWENMCYERGLRWGGLNADEPRINLFGGSLGIGNSTFAARIGTALRRDIFLPAFELRSDTALGYCDTIRRSRAHFLLGYSSAIYRLAVYAHEMKLGLKIQAVFPTAEPMFPEWEKLISGVLGCKVLPYYGCGEVNSLGFSKPGYSGYFIPNEHAVIEVMDSDGSTQEYGEGRFVITSLDNFAMPTLRYINGDVGEIGPCIGEGSPFSRIERLEGRYNSLLMTDSGDLISGAIGAHVFRLFPSVQKYQVVQEEPLRLVIKIIPYENFQEKNEFLIKELFSKHLGKNMKIQIEKVSEIPDPMSGKTTFVINRCLTDLPSRVGS